MVTFVNATIKRQLNCTGGRFRADEAKGIALSLDAAVVGGGVYLNEGFDAEGAVLLRWARVERQVNCSKGNFRNGQGTAIDAEHLVCEQNVDLSEANVVGSVLLRDARIRYDLNCGGTELQPGDSGVAFDGSEMLVQGTLRWRLDVSPGGRVLLTDTEVGQLDDTPESWSGPQRFDLRGFRYKSLTSASEDVWMRLHWLSRSDYYPQAYEQLQRCYRESGRQEEAAKVGIAGERARLAGTSRPLQKAWGWLLGATIGYGYRPQRAVTLIIMIMITGGILFHYAQHAYLMEPTAAPPDKRPISATVCTYGYPCFAPVTYQVDLMIPGANLRQKQYWTPDERSLPGKMLVVWVWWSSLAGWILVTLLVRSLVTGLDAIAKRAAS